MSKRLFPFLANFCWIPVYALAASVIILNRLILRLVIGRNNKAARGLLFLYLDSFHKTHRHLLRRLATPLLSGIHPKNVFSKRPEFFIESVSKDDIVIDIACGTARLLEKVSPLVKSAIGIDNDTKTIERARVRIGDSVILVADDIFGPQLGHLIQSNKVTVAFLSHILEHLPDVPTFLRTLQVPKLLICVPSQDSWIFQLMTWCSVNISTDPTHYREYTKSMLQAELRQADYECTFIGYNADGEIICEAIKSFPANSSV